MQIRLLLIIILILGLGHAARITVGPGDEDYNQIQLAIDNASVGDIIEVHSGIYRECVYIHKSLFLHGIDTGGGMPVIDADGSNSALTLAANGSIVQGFNLTNSGHCGCGNAGIQVISGNNTVIENIIYKNKYGIYVKAGYINNTFISNDFLENEIVANDMGGNLWNAYQTPEGMKRYEIAFGMQVLGNHYSDYDEPKEGCNDANNDGFCDQSRLINGGYSVDLSPMIKRGIS